METSPLLVLSVFVLGGTCGALFITLQRQARMDRIKAAFAEELREVCERTYAEYADATSNPVHLTEEPRSDMEEPCLDDTGEPEWMSHLQAPEPQRSHVNM